jgi:peptidoglycan/LPS O-acetylase OafA/YrhL
MAGSAICALAGLSNTFLWLESGYFDAASTLKPLLRTWSLGVAIQFYLLGPILLLGIARFSKNALVPVGAILDLGAAASVYYMKRDASAALFLAPFPIHEFLFGALVVFCECYKLSQFVSNPAYLPGMVLTGYAIFFFSSEAVVFPGLAALVPTAGAALVILGEPSPLH